MQSRIDENQKDLQYFYDKRRLAKKEVRELKKILKKVKNSFPQNAIKVCFQQQNISIIEEKIHAYLLRIKWCSIQIKNHHKIQTQQRILIDEIDISMDFYFEDLYNTRANRIHEYEAAA